MFTMLRLCIACLVGAAVGASVGCGGRSLLVPAYQRGRLSSAAVVASDSGVRVVVRTSAWPGPLLEFNGLQPIELTFDNASVHRLSIDQNHVMLVKDAGQYMSAIPQATLRQMADSGGADDLRLPIDQMRERALAEAVLPIGGRRTGFLYFERPHGAEQLDLEIALVSADSGTKFGSVRIPFSID